MTVAVLRDCITFSDQSRLPNNTQCRKILWEAQKVVTCLNSPLRPILQSAWYFGHLFFYININQPKFIFKIQETLEMMKL